MSPSRITEDTRIPASPTRFRFVRRQNPCALRPDAEEIGFLYRLMSPGALVEPEPEFDLVTLK
jgi:hypothetical protein